MSWNLHSFQYTYASSRLVLLVVLVVASSLVLPLLFRLFAHGPRNAAKAVVEYAQKRGYVLLNPSLAQAIDESCLDMLSDPALKNLTVPTADIADIEGLTNCTGGWLALSCEMGTREATIFNCGARPASVSFKVAKIKAGGLPRFSAGKRSVLHYIEAFVDRATGSASSNVQFDARIFPEFSAHFWVRSSNPAAVTEFFAEAKIRFLEAAQLEGILATNDRYLVYYEDGTLLNEKDFDEFIAAVQKIVANML